MTSYNSNTKFSSLLKRMHNRLVQYLNYIMDIKIFRFGNILNSCNFALHCRCSLCPVSGTDIQSDSITNQSLCSGYRLGNKNSLRNRWYMRQSPQSFPDICKLCHTPLLLSLCIPMSMKILKNASTNIERTQKSFAFLFTSVLQALND